MKILRGAGWPTVGVHKTEQYGHFFSSINDFFSFLVEDENISTSRPNLAIITRLSHKPNNQSLILILSSVNSLFSVFVLNLLYSKPS